MPTRFQTLTKIVFSKWLWLLLIVLIGGAAWYQTHKNKTPGGPGNVQWGGPGGKNIQTVGVASAVKTDIPVVLNALGTVTATANVTVKPQVSGVLQQVNFREGQMIKAGQVLATIDPRPFELTLMQVSGQRQRDEAQLDNARIILKRDLVLQAQDSIAQQDVEAQSALVKQLEGTVMADRAQEGTAKLNLSYTKVIAPVSGQVGLRTVDAGNIVNTSDANGIALITQVLPIDVVFAVPQNQVADILAETHGSSILKVIALDRSRADQLATGEFLALDNQVDTATGTVRAKARFSNENVKLFPNEFVNIKLVVRRIQDAIVVPISALRHGSKGDFVYVLDSETNTVAQRSVVAGQVEADRVQITSGLAAGEKVITEGGDRLKDGAKVKLPEQISTNSKGPDGKPSSDQKQDWKNRDWKKDGNKDGTQHSWRKKTEGDNATSSDKPDGVKPDTDHSGQSSSGSSEHRHKYQNTEQ
jgi:membrane fusion protein, multidrug efflux system